jgi:GTPase SAR1 family protein
MRARDNPFRTDRVLEVRYRLLQGTWDELLATLDTLRYRAAIVGPQGSGKTTLLEDLAPRLQARGYTVRELRLDTGTPRFAPGFIDRFVPSLTPRDVILFDGAEQLGVFAWRSFERRCRAAAGMVVTLHHPGRLPTLMETATSSELLAALVEQILGDEAESLRAILPQLYERHGGNLRDALRELYDRYAGLTSGPSRRA